MLTASRRSRIFGLALPIIGGMVSQNVLNLVDAAMVGALGNASLAGVGIASFANFMCIAFITGMSVGVQAMASRRKGEGRLDETAVPLNGGLVLVLVLAIPASIALFFAAPSLFDVLVEDAAVKAEAITYFRARILATVAVGANFAFRGYWSAVDLSRLYMRSIVMMHIANIAISYVLIFGHFGLPAMGVAGAGIGTAISLFLGSFYYVYLGLQYARKGGFLRGLPSRQTLVDMIRTAGPAGVQQFFFAAGLTTFFTLIEKVGPTELAASKVLTDLFLVAILPGLGFGIAAASLVGQSLGAGEPDAARQWGWDVGKLVMVFVGLLGLPALLIPDLLLMPFLHDEATRALAVTPLRLVAGTISIDALGMVMQNALLGAGDSRRVMVLSIGLQWGLALPLIYVASAMMGMGLWAIWGIQVAYRLIQAAIFAMRWKGPGWQAHRL